MTRPYALLRAGFPHVKCVGTLTILSHPIDVAVTKDLRLFVLRRFTSMGAALNILSWDDEDLGRIGAFAPSGARSPSAEDDGKMVWPAAVIFDRDENLVISDEGRHRINFLTQDGKMINSWGEQGSGPGQLDRPSGIALDAEENVYVVDTLNHRVQRFTKDGKYMTGWGSHGDGPGEFDMPWGIHVDELGDVYVVDWHNDRVQKFTGEGEFNRPAGIAVDADGDIYVADVRNNRVQLFNAEGRYVEKFVGEGLMSQSGRVYMLSNAREMRLREMSSIEHEKKFRSPRSVRVDAEGRMFVADYNCSRIQIYKKDAIPLDESQIWAPVRAPSLLMP
jgi:sugar lactone lactonase YvrE